MPFFLYQEKNSEGVAHRICPLRDRTSLWGKEGVVATCARDAARTKGRWHVEEDALLAELFRRRDDLTGQPSEFFIMDDLVPKGPEILLARIVSVTGYLEHKYNPFMLIMEEVRHLRPEKTEALDVEGRDQLKARVSFTRGAGSIIRTINYLRNGWRPPRSFSGALLWPQHWEVLRHL